MKIFAFSEFFQSSAAGLARLLNADGAALIVLDDPGYLRYKLFYGLEFVNQETITKFKFPADQGTAGRALASGGFLFTEDYPNSPDAMPEFVAAGLRSNLVFPLPGPHGFVGAVAISWIRQKPGALDPQVLTIVELFAALIGASLYREELERQLQTLSLHDALTGLPNRRMLMVRLVEAQKRAVRHQTLLVLAVLDLDGFKQLNDMFGHAEGDKILIRAARNIQDSIRTTDMVARLGGDEFVIILEDLNTPREAELILERVVRALHLTCEKGGVSANIYTSIGGTINPFDFSDPETLLVHADETMYLAKRAGGNRYLLKP
ncbi:MAG: sensor domain-containing diguanylate cyclase [Acidocella sp.]|nr:sensor domain-containing diguanylate cyclase [Acidocella sp.]